MFCYLTSFLLSLQSVLPVPTNNLSEVAIGEKVPDYRFERVLNADQMPIQLKELEGKPVIIEFWATWCSPCISAMQKLEKIDGIESVEVLAVSPDDQDRLLNYISATNTSFKVIYDTAHQKIFPYQIIPHAIVINKEGIVEAITNPAYITDETIQNLLQGTPTNLSEVKGDIPTNAKSKDQETLIYKRESSTLNIAFTLTSRRAGSRQQTLENEVQEAYSLSMESFSPWWLYVHSFQLSSPLRLLVDGFPEEELVAERYHLLVEKSPENDSTVYQLAQKTLIENLPFKTSWHTQMTESTYTLMVVDSTLLPEPSTKQKPTYSMMGPVMEGERIPIRVLIGYLEEHTMTPIVDKTGLTELYDMSLNWQYEAPQTVNRELGKYGLTLKRSESPQEILYLRVYK